MTTNESKWTERAHDRRPIRKDEWQQFLRETEPEAPTYTVQLVYDPDDIVAPGWFLHDNRNNSDSVLGPISLYRAGMLARAYHPNADIRLM